MSSEGPSKVELAYHEEAMAEARRVIEQSRLETKLATRRRHEKMVDRGVLALLIYLAGMLLVVLGMTITDKELATNILFGILIAMMVVFSVAVYVLLGGKNDGE